MRRSSGFANPSEHLHKFFWLLLLRKLIAVDANESLSRNAWQSAITQFRHRKLINIALWVMFAHLLCSEEEKEKFIHRRAALRGVID
jgi:hypothetical protein